MNPKIIVVMPAYNAAKTLERTYQDLPRHLISQVILVDDASRDRTVEIARHLGLVVVLHPQNEGYGANQKTCYLEALRRGADIVVMLHPDYQYDSRLVPELVAPIIRQEADMVLGSRFLFKEGPLAGGMPWWKYIANRFLTTVENAVLGLSLSELHTGFRAYNRRLLTTIPFLLNSDDFVFDTQVIAQAVACGFRLTEIAVPTRYFPEASMVNFRRSTRYGLSTLWTMLRFLLHKWQVWPSRPFRARLVDVLNPTLAAEILSDRQPFES